MGFRQLLGQLPVTVIAAAQGAGAQMVHFLRHPARPVQEIPRLSRPRCQPPRVAIGRPAGAPRPQIIEQREAAVGDVGDRGDQRCGLAVKVGLKMMDKARALPTSPQAQQQQKAFNTNGVLAA